MSPDDSSGASDSSQQRKVVVDRLSVDDSVIGETSLRRVNTDLLGSDRDIQKFIKKSYSLENLNIDVKAKEEFGGGMQGEESDGNQSWVGMLLLVGVTARPQTFK